MILELREPKIAVVGLGYVGLPLAIAFAKKYSVVGFDIDSERINELKKGIDRTHEADMQELTVLMNQTLLFSSQITSLSSCNIFIITVPTPIDHFKAPDLRPLLKATQMLAQVLKKNDIVIYESTVYPGCTEEDCVPVLEKYSQLKYNIDFYCGYSPERINPGDKVNTLTKIKKVTSGSTPLVAKYIDDLYASIIEAGTHLASNIKTAEASKAIENAQRDVNISFVNELALIFDRLGIDTQEVLEAAASKWNFLPFKPGLVGGHCIGVDPYYLAHKAESLGYHPQVILSGRRVNDAMPAFVAAKMVKMMIHNGLAIRGAKLLLLGATFKENCPDIRNSRAFDVYTELRDFGTEVDIYDPLAQPVEVFDEYQINLLPEITNRYDGIVLLVAHDQFRSLNLNQLKKSAATVVFDTKAFWPKEWVDGRL